MDMESQFKYFLQRDVVLSLNSKILKEGKLVLYSRKDYYFYLFLKTNNNQQKKIEIPYPFNIIKENNYLILDYTLQSISKNDRELNLKLMSLSQKCNSKFYNNKILFFEKNKLDLSLV